MMLRCCVVHHCPVPFEHDTAGHLAAVLVAGVRFPREKSRSQKISEREKERETCVGDVRVFARLQNGQTFRGREREVDQQQQPLDAYCQVQKTFPLYVAPIFWSESSGARSVKLFSF